MPESKLRSRPITQQIFQFPNKSSNRAASRITNSVAKTRKLRSIQKASPSNSVHVLDLPLTDFACLQTFKYNTRTRSLHLPNCIFLLCDVSPRFAVLVTTPRVLAKHTYVNFDQTERNYNGEYRWPRSASSKFASGFRSFLSRESDRAEERLLPPFTSSAPPLALDVHTSIHDSRALFIIVQSASSWLWNREKVRSGVFRIFFKDFVGKGFHFCVLVTDVDDNASVEW